MGRPKLNVGQCTAPECIEPQKTKKLCRSHYSQWRRTGQTTTVLKRQEIYSDGWKYCVSCTYWWPLQYFRYRSDAVNTVMTSKCLRCQSLARHNISGIEFDRLLFKQKGRCAGCGVYAKAGTRLHIDHNHQCCPSSKKTCGRCIRGLLCERCNWTLGKVKDSVENLQKLINYLERNKDDSNY